MSEAAPRQEYQQRLSAWYSKQERLTILTRKIGNARLAVGTVAFVIAALSLGAQWMSPWWLVVPILGFIPLAIWHAQIDTELQRATRATDYYQHALARIENRWIGTGRQGEQFRDPRHIYSDDLDLFGKGSLFELLSTARTSVGERLLASWLLSPGDKETILQRQAAVEELRSRVDLREDLALIGDEVRSAIDDQKLSEWGARPPAHFFAGARTVALVLTAAALVTLIWGITPMGTFSPFLVVVLIELGFSMAIRAPVGQVISTVDTPAKELSLMASLLERVEKEEFASALLKELSGRMKSGGSATRKIRALETRVEALYWARNDFARILVAPLLWTQQFAMAIEKWRAESGSHISEWVAAIGEFEALSSLASFAYEHPAAVFPDIVDHGPVYDAVGLAHPLIPANEAIANDVHLDGTCALWIVSGSNMSGKSTLLRAVGLSVVLAWAGAPVTAQRLRLSRLHVGASLRSIDSVTDHRSRFYAEISRLKDIMELAASGHPTIFLLDELLSGTNSHDRHIGAEALLLGIVERGAIGLATTHDLALAQIVDKVGSRAVNVHFEDQLIGGEIHFDYKLRPGVVARGNALELMRAVGLDV